jgi:hypothetical protein
LALAVKGTPTPAVLAAAYYTSTNLATSGVVIPSVSWQIVKNIATIWLTAATLPQIGYNGPNGYIPVPVWTAASKTQSFNSLTGQPFNIQGKFPAANGQKVVLWGFPTAPWNGAVVSVIDNNPADGSFRFYYEASNASATEVGNTAPCPFQHYRAIRLECAQDLSTDLIYVGDANVSATQYMACLSLAGQLSIEIASENIPSESLCIDTNGTASTDHVMVTVLY